MRIVCLILGLMIAAPTFAGTLYLGSSPAAKPQQLRKAWKAVEGLDQIDAAHPDVVAMIDPAKLEDAATAQAKLDAIEPVLWPLDAVGLAGGLAVSGIVVTTTPDLPNCHNFTQAAARAVEVCGAATEVKSASVGAMRRFWCKPKADESLWGIEICE